MEIAVNTSCLTKDENSVQSIFIREVFQRLTALHKDSDFIFIFDEAPASGTAFWNNAAVLTGLPVNTFLKKIVWYNVKLPQLLRKHKAEVLVTPGFCSLVAKVPQCLILPDVSYMHSSAQLNKRQFGLYKRNIGRAVKKANRVIVLSGYEKDLLGKNYNIAADKIDVVRPGLNDIYQPITAQQREQVKEAYADGFEYFICRGKISNNSNLTNLLKAFSFFKKRQKSSMKLLLASTSALEDEAFIERFRLFRFKEEVKLLPGLGANELAKIVSAAYANIFSSLSEDLVIALPQALGAGVPVITTGMEPSREICKEAALYIDEKSFEDIALKMMEIFKDEALGKALIEKGKLRAENFSWDAASEAVWKSVQKAKRK